MRENSICSLIPGNHLLGLREHIGEHLLVGGVHPVDGPLVHEEERDETLAGGRAAGGLAVLEDHGEKTVGDRLRDDHERRGALRLAAQREVDRHRRRVVEIAQELGPLGRELRDDVGDEVAHRADDRAGSLLGPRPVRALVGDSNAAAVLDHLEHAGVEPHVVEPVRHPLRERGIPVPERIELRPEHPLPEEEELDHRDHLGRHTGAAADRRLDQVVVELAVEPAAHAVVVGGLDVVLGCLREVLVAEQLAEPERVPREPCDLDLGAQREQPRPRRVQRQSVRAQVVHLAVTHEPHQRVRRDQLVLHPDVAHEPHHRLVGLGQDRRAGLHQEAVALDREQLAPDAILRLEDDDVPAGLLQPPGGGQARRAGARDEDRTRIRRHRPRRRARERPRPRRCRR